MCVFFFGGGGAKRGVGGDPCVHVVSLSGGGGEWRLPVMAVVMVRVQGVN